MASAIQLNPYAQHYQLAGTTTRSIAAVLQKIATAAGGADRVCTLDITGITKGAVDRLPDLSAFVNVEIVILSENNFSRIPEEVIRLPKVEKLVLDHCPNLDTLAGIEQMPKLREIEAEGCSLKHWPAELVKTQVETINLLGSEIFDIPLELCPASLKEVWISEFSQWYQDLAVYVPGGLNVDRPFMNQFEERPYDVDGKMAIRYTRIEGAEAMDMGAQGVGFGAPVGLMSDDPFSSDPSLSSSNASPVWSDQDQFIAECLQQDPLALSSDTSGDVEMTDLLSFLDNLV